MAKINIQTTIKAPLEKVWKYYTEPEHITQWNHASDDWHCPHAENDLRVGGKFMSRMEAKDGSFGFDFGGTYDEVKNHELIEYHMDDQRVVKVMFNPEGESTKIIVEFDPETENSIEMQKGGWQAILDNFNKHVEDQ